MLLYSVHNTLNTVFFHWLTFSYTLKESSKYLFSSRNDAKLSSIFGEAILSYWTNSRPMPPHGKRHHRERGNTGRRLHPMDPCADKKGNDEEEAREGGGKNVQGNILSLYCIILPIRMVKRKAQHKHNIQQRGGGGRRYRELYYHYIALFYVPIRMGDA